MQRFSLRDRPLVLQWLALLGATLIGVALLDLLQLSAALLLGSMFAGILVASSEGRVQVPVWPYRLAQGLIGCLIARSMSADILHEMLAHWVVFVFTIGSVLVLSTLLGGLLARLRVLPGTTAVWGSAPGAATVMALMAEAFGGDVRLVAFMQFTRVMVVALVASLVARLWTGHAAGPAGGTLWFPALEAAPFALTLLVAFGGALLGSLLGFPAGALLLPLLATIVLINLHVLQVTLPPWLLAGSYALVGWSIGLRFTREIVVHAARAFPKVLASILTLIVLCGGLAWVLHLLTGADPLTCYLATSPGGADSVAIIAASSPVDLPFVMAMQSGRFLLVLAFGPSLARLVARYAVPP